MHDYISECAIYFLNYIPFLHIHILCIYIKPIYYFYVIQDMKNKFKFVINPKKLVYFSAHKLFKLFTLEETGRKEATLKIYSPIIIERSVQ